MDRGGRFPQRSRTPDLTALRYQHVGREITILLKAVTICMFSVAALVRMFSFSRNPALEIPYMRYPDEEGGASVLFISSFANAFSFLAIIMMANCTLVFLYKGGHYGIVKAWLMTGSALLLFVTGYYFLGRLLFFFNFPTDHFSCALVTWNVGAGGIVALYFDAPRHLQQGYIVYTSVLMAIVLEEAFPNWTSWIFLLLVSMWDVFAVLCMLGPLRILHETAKERNEPLFPGLLFSTSSAWCYEIASTVSDTERNAESSRAKRASEDSDLIICKETWHETVDALSEDTGAAPVSATASNSALVLPGVSNDILKRMPSQRKATLMPADLVLPPGPVAPLGPQCRFTDQMRSTVYSVPTDGQVCAVSSTTPTALTMHTPLSGMTLTYTMCADHNRYGDSHGRCPPKAAPSLGYAGRRGYEHFSLTPSCNSEDSFGARGIASGQRSPSAPPPSAQAGTKSGAYSPRSPRLRSPEQRRPLDQEQALERGLKLGLGDFIFYGMLLGKASQHGTVAAVVACCFSVLVGALLTVTLLVVFRKPVPALPFSVLLGLGAYFASAIFLDPFLEAIDFLTY